MGMIVRVAIGNRGATSGRRVQKASHKAGTSFTFRASLSKNPTIPMKKSLVLTTAALGAALLAGLGLFAQSGGSNSILQSAAPATRPVLVSTLRTVEANKEFQTNVQIMQAKRQQVIETGAALEKETDAAKKKELKAKLDDLLVKLNEDNQKMIKAYGFSLERNYVLVPEVAHVYMIVTEEEAARFEKAAAQAAKKEPAKKK